MHLLDLLLSGVVRLQNRIDLNMKRRECNMITGCLKSTGKASVKGHGTLDVCMMYYKSH